MKRTAYSLLIVLTVALAGLSQGCKTIGDIATALTSVKKLQFKLGNTNNFRVNGVDITRLSQPSQIGFGDIARLTAAFAQKQLPVEFTLNVLARNPNDGSGGSKATNLFLKKMDWTLLINDRTTINGVVNQRLEIPGSGQTTTIPLTISLDLYKFFGDKGFDDLLGLAFAIGGVGGSSSNLKLTARVTAETPLGDVTYPGDITIIDRDFTSQ